MNRTAIISLALIVVISGTLTGCGPAGYLTWLFLGDAKTVEVPADFEGLPERRVAIVVYTDMGVQYEYSHARLGLSMAIGSELKKHVDGVTFVDPQRVVTYQDENVHWESMDRAKLGQILGADYVLYVALDEYTMREPGSINLFRGRIVDVARTNMMIELSGPEEKLEAFTDLVRPYGIRELARTGVIAMPRGKQKNGQDKTQDD